MSRYAAYGSPEYFRLLEEKKATKVVIISPKIQKASVVKKVKDEPVPEKKTSKVVVKKVKDEPHATKKVVVIKKVKEPEPIEEVESEEETETEEVEEEKPKPKKIVKKVIVKKVLKEEPKPEPVQETEPEKPKKGRPKPGTEESIAWGKRMMEIRIQKKLNELNALKD